MCWESGCDLRLSLWERWKDPSSSPYTLGHSLELTVNLTLLCCALLEEYTRLSPQLMCQGNAFCFTYPGLAFNGSFPVFIESASPPMVSEHVALFGRKATAILSHLEKRTCLLIFRCKTAVSLLLWESALRLLQLLAWIGEQNLSSALT